MLSRRQFALASTAGLASATAHRDRFAVAEIPALENKRLVELGINALARAPQRSYFANGHRGASMISAHLMCVDNQLGDETKYWQQRGNKTLGLGHVFKYPYAYYDLIARANNPSLAKRLEAKAWQIF